VVCVVVVVVEVVSGVVDCWLGKVEDGDVEEGVDWEFVVSGVVDDGDADCVLVVLLVDDDCELGVDVLCATTQTADSSRIAVIRYAFLICSSYTFGQQIAPAN
jgi:hypothetical protein